MRTAWFFIYWDDSGTDGIALFRGEALHRINT